MTAINDNRPPLPVPAGDWALFLGIDGTILDIAATPDGVSPFDRLRTARTSG